MCHTMTLVSPSLKRQFRSPFWWKNRKRILKSTNSAILFSSPFCIETTYCHAASIVCIIMFSFWRHLFPLSFLRSFFFGYKFKSFICNTHIWALFMIVEVQIYIIHFQIEYFFFVLFFSKKKSWKPKAESKSVDLVVVIILLVFVSFFLYRRKNKL